MAGNRSICRLAMAGEPSALDRSVRAFLASDQRIILTVIASSPNADAGMPRGLSLRFQSTMRRWISKVSGMRKRMSVPMAINLAMARR